VVEPQQLPEGTVRVPPDQAGRFVEAVFAATGVPAADAALAARVLIAADLRGIRSHGLARLQYFAHRLESGVINTEPEMRLERLTDTTGRLDADNGLGIVAADRAMAAAIEMAARHGSGFMTVNRSNHFGFAGYWAEVAMQQGLIGISMANSGRRVTPTYGSESLLGTNPMAIAIPGGADGTDFYLDMGTSTVSVGKIETALREGRPVPAGWVSEAGEVPVLDERGTLTFGAPLLPLGGEGKVAGGHKGYGLSLLVELLCGALAGSSLDARIATADGSGPGAMGHFFGALRVEGFRAPEQVHADMARTFDLLRNATKVPGEDRVFIHGEPEALAAVENSQLGLPVPPRLMQQLEELGQRYEVSL
jgi:LDH2 family malate/lactate/ureidoglycolate dehydrogenase